MAAKASKTAKAPVKPKVAKKPKAPKAPKESKASKAPLDPLDPQLPQNQNDPIDITPDLPEVVEQKKSNSNRWWKNPMVNKAIMRTGRVAETEDQRRAFDEYLAMGDNRSISGLAQKIGRDRNVLMRWAAKHKWMERVIEWSQQTGMARSIQPLDQEIASKRLAVSICDKIIANAAILDEEGNFKDTTIVARSVQDLQRVLETKNAILYGNQGKQDSGKRNTQIGQAVFIIKK